jgi:glutaredoxin
MTTETDGSGAVTATPATVTLVESRGCHFCADAEDALADASRDFDVRIHRVDTRSPEGLAMIQEFGAAMSPLVLLDGAFVSAGRLSRGKLRKLLEARLDRSAVSSR